MNNNEWEITPSDILTIYIALINCACDDLHGDNFKEKCWKLAEKVEKQIHIKAVQ